MNSTWLKVKVWTKLTVFFLVLVYLLMFVANNAGQPVKFWYWFGRQWDTSLLYFTFFTFLAGVVVMILARTILKTVGQFREMRHRTEQERRDRELSELRTKAAMLQQRPASGTNAPADPAPPATDRPATDPSPAP